HVSRNESLPSDYNVESVIILENKDTRAIKLTTQYDIVQVSNSTTTRS
ncbi:16915_t:CDS:1, partial [Dentiscutata heterogama]